MQAPEFIYGKCKKIFSETRSARKKASASKAPKFIYGVFNFEFIILNFEFPEGVTSHVFLRLRN